MMLPWCVIGCIKKMTSARYIKYKWNLTSCCMIVMVIWFQLLYSISSSSFIYLKMFLKVPHFTKDLILFMPLARLVGQGVCVICF